MKTHLFVWILFAPLAFLIGEVNGQVVKYPCYTSYWNAKTLIPDSVIWIAKPHTKTVGREAGFHSTSGRQNLSRDYAHSEFDIGHNADASDMNANKTDEYNSFDFVNTYPQRPNCNRLTWLALENYTRRLNMPVKVKVSYIGLNGAIGVDKVYIPKYCVKELWYRGHYEKYVIPNQDTCIKHSFTFYRVK
jgi:DNA/RNA endonuclease G (NUC1)